MHAADVLPDARAAIAEIGAFVQTILNGNVRPASTRHLFSRQS